MKKSIVGSTSFNYCLSSCFLFLGLACSTGTKIGDQNKPSAGSTRDTSFKQETPPDQLIIWRKPEKTEEDYQNWLKRFRDKWKGDVKDVNYCGSCDENSLRLITGPGVKTFIQTEAVNGQVTAGTKSPVTGEDEFVYFSQNYRVRQNKPRFRISSVKKPTPGSHAGNPVKVAVLDTGLDPEESKNYSYNYSNECCIKGAERGWNFIQHNGNYSDDDDMKHGTIVTRFITEQVTKHGKTSVEILPVKTHDANGESDLYSILCAFAYAQKMGVQIVQASFGFYVPRRILSGDNAPPDLDIILLRKYVEYYLTNHHILLVTAAGNSDIVNLKKTFAAHEWPYRPNDPNDLDDVSFFPASLARNPDFPNVIAVTTVFINKGKAAVSPDQNFSENVVDIGVEADAMTKDGFVFNHPLLNNGEGLQGSSFAAPKVTGLLCANYDRIKAVIEDKNFKTVDIWKKLGPQLVKSHSGLNDKIKGGKFIERLK